MHATLNSETAAHNAERECAKFANLETRTWLSSQQAARYAGYSEGAWAGFVRARIAPPSVLCGRNARRFRRTDIDAWIAAGGPAAFRKNAPPDDDGRRSIRIRAKAGRVEHLGDRVRRPSKTGGDYARA